MRRLTRRESSRQSILPPQAKGNPPSWAGKAARQGVVSVSHPLAAEAGARVLERGECGGRRRGNPVRAECRRAAVLGIGGGGFMMIHLAKTNETFAIDWPRKGTRHSRPRRCSCSLACRQPSCSAFAVDQRHRRRRAGDAEGN